jgi:hypothetical protein
VLRVACGVRARVRRCAVHVRARARCAACGVRVRRVVCCCVLRVVCTRGVCVRVRGGALTLKSAQALFRAPQLQLEAGPSANRSPDVGFQGFQGPRLGVDCGRLCVCVWGLG